ncbi:MAG: class I SAM-dependent methyltransferase [Acidobacteriota bacterium]
MDETESAARERTKAIAAEFAARGDTVGWFEALYRESAGDTTKIPWADLEPNRFLTAWAEETSLRGGGRTALVVGCGLGDDARYLYDLGFKVTGFDISPTAIEWARKLHKDTDIQFETADLFDPLSGWLGAFDLVLEVYTIQPLPLEIRPKVIDAIAAFVADGGKLIVVTRGRDDDEIPDELPWALSRADLSHFADAGLTQTGFVEMLGDEAEPVSRFVVEYERTS